MSADTGLWFTFTPEQLAFQESLRTFVDKRLTKDLCREAEASEQFPRHLWDMLAEQGLFGVGIDEKYGGQGGGIIEQVIIAEQLSRSMAGLIWMWGTTAFAGIKAIGYYGSDEQKERFLPAVATGEALYAISLTEPDGGTDVLGSMKTRATKVDGGWRINGSKIWTTMGHVADMLFVVARTSDEAKPSRGITVFLCDAKAEGVTATTIPKLGMRSLGSCEVHYDGVFVPDENVLGEIGGGWRLLAETLNSERIMVSANCCGALQGVLDEMLRYAMERTVFGKPLGQMQAVQHMIANAFMSLQSSQLLTYRAAWLQQNGQPCGVESTLAKVTASEAVFKAADDGFQIFGGYGYSLEYDIQRYWRDMRLYRIAPVNNEMGRNYVAESLGLPRSF